MEIILILAGNEKVFFFFFLLLLLLFFNGRYFPAKIKTITVSVAPEIS